MSRARRARRIAAAAAFGGGGVGMLGAAGFALLVAEARLARRWIGRPFGLDAPDAGRIYGAGPGKPIELAMIGDSSAAGLGVEVPDQAPGAVIAIGLAALTGRPVRLTVGAVVGAESSALDEQIDRVLAGTTPAAAVIMVGANDVTHRIKPAVAVRALDAAVRRLREAGAEVVVGTCPDLGTIEPIAPPLRHVARRLSRQLAAAQTIAVVEAGGRTVSLGDMLGPEFAARPREMFSADRFHPSAAGYARAAAALLPSVAAALGYWPEAAGLRPDRADVDDVAHAAARATRTAGTEVAGIKVDGAARGPRGRWAVLRLRRGVVAVTTAGAGVAWAAQTAASGARAIFPGARDGGEPANGEDRFTAPPALPLGSIADTGGPSAAAPAPQPATGQSSASSPSAEEEPCPKP